MCFDASERRLLTGANDGTVKMWNFSNGKVTALKTTLYLPRRVVFFDVISKRDLNLKSSVSRARGTIKVSKCSFPLALATKHVTVRT